MPIKRVSLQIEVFSVSVYPWILEVSLSKYHADKVNTIANNFTFRAAVLGMVGLTQKYRRYVDIIELGKMKLNICTRITEALWSVLGGILRAGDRSSRASEEYFYSPYNDFVL